MLIDELRKINDDDSVHGVLLLKPLPAHMDEKTVCSELMPSKDVDGITEASMAGVYSNSGMGYPPCTAEACLEILKFYGIERKGKKAAVIGRSLVIGKPVAMMLIKEDATVTICHTKTTDMPQICSEAEILIAAAGKAKTVDGKYFNSGQIVIDVGINVDDDGNLCGDVDFSAAEGRVKAVTPVPGGVGTVTTGILMKHVVEAAEKAGK
jgi:methylenetetrahydrofolate dehydrogenase (NADP+)/methenyltetrahydrofolate cyclohydrolase